MTSEEKLLVSDLKKAYDKDTEYITEKFKACKIPNDITKSYLDYLLNAYVNISNIKFESNIKSYIFQITNTHLGDKLTLKQRNEIVNCSTYLIKLHEIRLQRGEIHVYR